MSTERFSLDILEFHKAVEILATRLRTPLARPLLAASEPSTDHNWLERRFREIGEAYRLLMTGHVFPFDGILDIHPLLAKAELAGSLLDGPELITILETLRSIRRLRVALRGVPHLHADLDKYVHSLLPTDDLEDRLSRSFDPDGTLKDSASPELARIRDRIRRQRAHIQRRLEELCRNTDIRAMLQEDYFTERGGRYVLPVQSNYKRRIPGIQHGKSVTGTTAYIEPMDLVEPGNLLTEAIEEESEEVLRILRELTGEVRIRIPFLMPTLNAVAHLDLFFSLAEYTLDVQAVLPEIMADGPIQLVGFRHPILLEHMPREQVVANQYGMEPDTAAVFITGPNTGGKTVVLKSVGLMCSLALSGLPIPCREGTRIPLLGGVLADIGDSQSIEASLSTFSAHVARMKTFRESTVQIRAEGGPRPLIILDELGAGTDPSEGAALGRALVEDLIEQGAWVLVATHIGDLKVFGFEHPNIRTAAMRFDGDEFRPTYELALDSIGESHGIEIANRLGLPESLIRRAEELLESNPNQSVSVLHRLTEEERRAREGREEADRDRALAARLKEQLSEQIEKMQREKKHILDQARKDAESRVQAAKRRMSEIEKIIEKEEEKLRQGFEGRERDIQSREKQITWMEKELQERLNLLADLVQKFPNVGSELLESSTLQRLAARLEPDWKRILREINREQDQIAEQFPLQESRMEALGIRPEWDHLAEGDWLKIEGMDQPVSIESLDIRKKRINVLLGNLRTEIPFDRVLLKIERPSGSKVREVHPVQVRQPRNPEVASEINLIGMTTDEMEPVLTRYLDDAALSGWESVRVIHGHGTGALRRSVRKLLETHPVIARFDEADVYEGGAGATVAVLRK